MTTYILAGGNDRFHNDYGLRLAAEVHKHIDSPIHVLSCFFADSESVWQDKASYWEKWFRDNFGGDLQYSLASIQEFPAQVSAANVVYLHGGESNELMLKRMKAFPDIADAFEGKVVVGSSAGTNYLSRKFWTRSKRQVRSGSGILPANVMVHYGSKDGGFNDGPVDWDEANAKMEAAAGDGQILRIGEGEFTVIEQ